MSEQSVGPLAGGEEDELTRLRRLVEELTRRLAEREPRIPYQAVVDQLPLSVIVHRPDGTAVAVNDQVVRSGGIPREEIVGKYNIHDDPSAVASGFTAAFDRAANGETVSMPPTCYGQSEPGSLEDRRLWFQTTYKPLPDPDGLPYVVAMSFDITEQQRADSALRERSALLQSIIDNSPLVIATKSLEGRYLLMNRSAASYLGMTPEQVIGKSDDDFYTKEVADEAAALERQVIAEGKPMELEQTFALADGPHHFTTTKFPLRDVEGRIYAVCTISADITSHKRAEAENRRLQEDIIRVQAESLRALSTPLLPIASRAVLVPLVGALDRARAAHVQQMLLAGVAAHGASIAILDITGVPAVDEGAAAALLDAARAVRLVGAEVVLTGIQPSIAKALVELGTDLSGIVIRGTLESGITYALRR